jgi:hypothetical protein
MPKKRKRLDPVLREPPPTFPGPPVASGDLPSPPRTGQTKAVLKEKDCVVLTNWKDGKKHGPETVNWPDQPDRFQRTLYKHDKKHGLFVTQDPRLTQTLPYVDGVVHGLETVQFPEGHLMAVPHVRGVMHGLAVHRIQDPDGESCIRIDEYKDGVVVDDAWIMKTLNGGLRPGEAAEKRRRAAFDNLTTAIESADLSSGAYKDIYDAAQALHKLL